MPERAGAVNVESIERAIVAAVAPPVVEECDGWIIAYDDVTVSRAKSAAPLRHDRLDANDIAAICKRYRARALPPMFRLPDVPGMAHLHDALAQQCLRAEQPTQVQVARTADVARASGVADVQVDCEPDDAWCAVFLGEGFDPVDGASRVRTLRRAAGSRFASIREGGSVVAAGVLAVGHSWASVHGMRTAVTHRSRGLATRVLAHLAQLARGEGYDNMMLQVEKANTPAQQLYAKCGFSTAWTYLYWRQG